MSDVIYLDHFRAQPLGSARKGFTSRTHSVATRSAARPTPEDRDARAKQWFNAIAVLDYWSAVRRVTEALAVVEHRGLVSQIGAPTLEAKTALQREREAMTKLLLTPAPFAVSVSRKRTIHRSQHFQFLGLPDQQYEAQLAADEAFLDACPRRQRRKAGQS